MKHARYFLVIAVLLTVAIWARKKENYQQELKVKWQPHLKDKIKFGQSGAFIAQDKFSMPVMLEWKTTNMLLPDFSLAMKRVWDIAHSAFLPVEMKLLKKYPKAMKQDEFFESAKSLFKKNTKLIDWKAVEEKVYLILKDIYVLGNLSFSNEAAKLLNEEVYVFVNLKHEGKLLGFATFLIRPEYNFGDVKVMDIAVTQDEQNRGLAKLLMSSILKIIPQSNRIFLSARITNDKALQAYRAWGFSRDQEPIEDPFYKMNKNYSVFLEYKSDKLDLLQKVAKNLSKI